MSEPPIRTGRRGSVLRYVIAILGLVVLIGVLAAVKGAQISQLIGFGKTMQAAGPPPEIVSTARAEMQRWERTLSAIASLVSVSGVGLSNDAPGIVSRLHFDSGAIVRQGSLLVELDTSVERAQLSSLRARQDLAKISLERSRALVGSGAIAQSQVDADDSTFKSLSADANALQAQIARKSIRAPFSGKLGIRTVNLGQYLPAGTPVATLDTVQSVFADFTLPQQELEKLKVGMPVRASKEEGSVAIAEGTISAIDPAIDEATRSIRVRATLPNAANKLRAGMFVRASVVLPEQQEFVAVPVTAIVHASFGDSLFYSEPKAGADGKPGLVARQSFVRLGETRGDFVAVLEGLKAGQEVVTSGAFKLRNGAPIVVNNQIKLDPKLAPKPENR